MAQQSPLAQLVSAQLAKYPTLDPRAVMAIAGHEGLSGGIGDNGTSYGPFQLHVGGALPNTIGALGPQAANRWAWSPAGIDYALSRIASVAGGLSGLPAITAISTRFERPANPQAEIRDAASRYGAPIPVPGRTGPASSPTTGSAAAPPQAAPPPVPSAGMLASLMSPTTSAVVPQMPDLSSLLSAPQIAINPGGITPPPKTPFQSLNYGSPYGS